MNGDVWTTSRLTPFGLELTLTSHAEDPERLPVDLLPPLVSAHRVVLLRGLRGLEGEAFPAFCARLGEILEWEFGAVNDLRAREHATNYLYTTREVPFHWDGAFVGRIPRFIVFHCTSAPARGGETLFADTTRLLASAPAALRARWAELTVSYTTEKIAHYGGTFASPMLGRHPVTGEPTIRFAEPVDDVNPVSVEIAGLSLDEREEVLSDMRIRLRAPNLCYAHEWREGDLLVADNHALLHGRRAFENPARRWIRRVNVL